LAPAPAYKSGVANPEDTDMPIINRIGEMAAEMAEWRHDFHMHPETAFEEVRTSGIVAEKLKSFGLDEVVTGIAKTGVVGVLHGKSGKSGRSVALRADMDALDMEEKNDFAHRSRNPGKMHGCGHDGHTTMLLGAAKYLAETRNFDGTVYFVFQPAEEGQGGGLKMVEEGLFDRFPAQSVYAMHNWPELPMGKAAVRAGPMMAAADRFVITVSGKGGHAALPHHCIDPVVISAQIILAAQTLVSRNTDPLDQAVVSIPMVHGGSAFNVIPDSVELCGTVRSFKPETRTRLHEGLAKLAAGIAESMGGAAVTRFTEGYPPTVNTEAEAGIFGHVAAKILGEDNVVRNPEPCMGAEDFSYMLEARPGAYLWLGQAGKQGGCMVHNPRYDFNDEILPVGASFWAELVHELLPAGR
jgi:hippurate hydrolase